MGEVPEDDRLEGIELELTALGRHGDGEVVAHDVEGHLIHDLRDDRIHLSRHDRGAVLLRRKVDLVEAAARTGGHETQVVTHLREVDGAGLDGTGDGHETVEVLGGVHEVEGLHELEAGDHGEIRYDAAEVHLVRIDTRADGGAAHVQTAHLVLCTLQAGNISTYGLTVGPELLSESNRDRVLQLSAAHLQDIIELLSLIRERLIETLQLDLCLDEELEHGDLTGGWEDVVRGLTAVYVVVWIYEGVVALFTAEDLDRTVRDDLVRVHVEARACAALDRVDDEGVAELAGDDLVTGLYDSVRDLLVEETDLEVRDGGGLLDFYDGVDDFRMHLQSGDVEVLGSTK